jgi:flagellar hook-length control protein FliK
MASAPTASTFSAPAGAPAAPGASLLPSFATTPSSAAPQPGGVQTADAFLQLFAGMINATTGNAPAAAAAMPLDPAALPLECDADALLETLEPGDTSDTDSDDTDTDSDDAGALAVAALLPGLVSAPATTPSGGAAPQGTADGPRVDLAAMTTARIAAEVAEAAVDALSDDTADAAANPSRGTTDSPAPAPTAQTVVSTTAHMTALLNTHAATIADSTPDVIVQSPVGSTEWKDEVGAHITLLAVNGREAASLRLSPEHLGPVEVRISVDDGKASVYFGAANADTRSALEQSLPRLRELFATQGLVLADAGVSRDAPRNQFKPTATPNGARSSSDAGPDASVKSVTLARVGLIDTYV